MPDFEDSPFHPGEEDVQRRSGAFDLSLNLGKAWHERRVSASTAQFLATQQLLYLATINKDGRLWASVIAGPLGFLKPEGSDVLAAEPFYRIPSDPAELNKGGLLGSTAITLETRQRHRLNGRIQDSSEHRLAIAVEQSFGGCPKYIQARRLGLIEDRLDDISEARDCGSGGTQFGQAQEDLISRSDTLFLASCYEGPLEGGKGVQGCDISHRGGVPGFVQIKDRSVLSLADYIGNFTFTTLGNLAADSRASIIFLDFTSGDILQLSGQCQILWEDRTLPGAQRVLQFTTEQWVHTRSAVPLGPASAVNWSPYNPLPSCEYSKAAEDERIQQLHNNYVVSTSSPYFVARCLEVTYETPNVKTFTFEGSERGAVPESGYAFCEPGQFASFDFPHIKDGEVLNRTWTVSSPQEVMRTSGTSSGYSFSITIKKIGVVSSWMFDNMQSGRTIHFRGVDGDFTLQKRIPDPQTAGILLIAGGIGITPMRVILHDCISRGIPATLLYSVRSLSDAALLDQLEQVVSRSELAELHVTVTGKEAGSTATKESHANGVKKSSNVQGPKEQPQSNGTHSSFKTSRGRVTAALISEVCLDYQQRDVFLCGPTSMMNAVESDLLEHDFPAQRLHQESFTF